MTHDPETTSPPPTGEAAPGGPAPPAEAPDPFDAAFAALKARLQEQLSRMRALGREVTLATAARLDADASIAETALADLQPEPGKKKRRRRQVRRLERLVERLAAVEVDAAHARARDLKLIARSLGRALTVLTES